MFGSIKTRLTITICFILLMTFSVQIAANFLLAGDYYVYQKMKMMKEVYHQVVKQADTTDNSVVDIIRGLEVDNNFEIFLADENGAMIYSNRIPRGFAEREDPRNKIVDFDFAKYPKEYYTVDKPTLIKSDMQDGERLRLFSKIDRDDTSYYLTIRLSVKSISEDMRSTNLFILYISALAIVIGCFLVYFISKQFVKPIEEINKVAVNVSKMDFSIQAQETRRKDELGSLAANINLMSVRLEENIKNLKEVNKKLESDNVFMNKVDEQRMEFIANISHELKTPLAILSGYSEMLKNDVPGIDKSFYYDTILDETAKMNILIQSLLNLSNIENSLTLLSLEEMDVLEFTERIYRKIEILLKSKGLVGEFTALPCGKILADPLYLEEAINNYIANAINYTKKGHLIRMKIEQVGEEAVISVYNEGNTIDEAHMDKIWNSFYRADRSRTRTVHNNIGLGLYIVRSIMNAHHGSCGVINHENGVEFWLSLKTI